MRQISQDARVMGIVFDDQQYRVSGLENLAVVWELFHRHLGQPNRRESRSSRRVYCRGKRDHRRRAHTFDRQEEREGAADPRSAAQLDLAAKQVGQLATNREPEPGAAKPAVGAGVGLLERLEDDFLLFRRDADTRIGDLEGHHFGRVLQDWMIWAPAADRGVNAQLDAAWFGEFEGV